MSYGVPHPVLVVSKSKYINKEEQHFIRDGIKTEQRGPHQVPYRAPSRRRKPPEAAVDFISRKPPYNFISRAVRSVRRRQP